MPSSANTYSPFEKQLLASYGAMAGTEHLTMGHQVIMQPDPPVVNWLSSDTLPCWAGTAATCH